MTIRAGRPRWLLDRRTLLRGTGGAALALPLLDAMRAPRKAYAAAPSRYLTFFSPGGREMEAWRPKGTEDAFTLGASLAPLERLKRHLVVMNGLDLKVTAEGAGHPHSKGMGGLLTGEILPPGPYVTNGGNAGFSLGTSIDQYLGPRLAGDRKFKTIEMAIRWPSDGTDGLQVHPWNTIMYSAPGKPVVPATNPRLVFDRLFKDVTGVDQAEQRRSRRILDAVLGEYKSMAARVGAADKTRLDAHLTDLEELQRSLDVKVQGCVVPDMTEEIKGPFTGGSDRGGDGYVDNGKDVHIPRTGKVMMDMMALALACDLTRVGTVQWMDSQSNNSFPWLSLNDTHHGYQHDRGYNPDAIRKIDVWYATQFAYFLDRLLEKKEGDRTLLDSTLVFWGTEISHPALHAQNDMPFILAGGAGGRVRTGRWLRLGGKSHNDLLVSILQSLDQDVKTYGRARYCTGPLPGLVG
jgi:hypothetical protein